MTQTLADELDRLGQMAAGPWAAIHRGQFAAYVLNNLPAIIAALRALEHQP